MPPRNLLSRRLDADRKQLAGEIAVGFAHRLMRQTGEVEAVRQLGERCFVFCYKHHDVHVLAAARITLACCMRDVGRLKPSWDVSSDDHVVKLFSLFGRRRFAELSVVALACFNL